MGLQKPTLVPVGMRGRGLEPPMGLTQQILSLPPWPLGYPRIATYSKSEVLLSFFPEGFFTKWKKGSRATPALRLTMAVGFY